jgi:FlaA1/EpsC-like NDP-sugar epimerase
MAKPGKVLLIAGGGGSIGSAIARLARRSASTHC